MHRRRAKTGPLAVLEGLGSSMSGEARPAFGALLKGRGKRVAAAAAGAGVVAAVVVVVVLALSGGGKPEGTGSNHLAAKPPPSSTTTTVAAVSLVSSNATDATYRVAMPSYTVALTSDPGPCWVEVRSGGATGPMVWAGLLGAGQTKTVPASGPLWVRVGFEANISISVNGASVQKTTPTPNPYNFTFETG